MGSGTWSPNTYRQRVQTKKSKGQDAFDYSQGASGVHPTLDPYGLEVRESRDNDDHPQSNSIIVGLDVSGSMGVVVRGIHKDLPQLLGLLGRGYVQSPQIMFAAFSNGRCDKVPVQVGQFESDNRMDENLENMILGGRLAGGCDSRESAELLVYLAARHTSIDCYEKRHKKGYLFLITDEMAYDVVNHKEINRIFGRDLKEDIPFQTIVAEAQEKYHCFVIVPTKGQATANQQVVDFFKGHFDPQHVIVLENADDVSETMALAIGLTEGMVSLQQGLNDLATEGASEKTIDALSRALSVVGEGGVAGTGITLDDGSGDDGKRGARRL